MWWRGRRTAHVLLDQTPEQVDALFSNGANLFARYEALPTVYEMFDPDYQATDNSDDPDDHQDANGEFR